MNQILPGLFIGSLRDSRNHEQLSGNGITHILSIHETAKRGSVQGVQYLVINAADSLSQNLGQFFPQCNDFIHKARQSGGKVLVHCLAGVSRSVTITVAYLLSITTLTYKQTLEAVRRARKISDPNPYFQRQLVDFERFHLKHERAHLAQKYPGLIPSKADEDELRALIGQPPVPLNDGKNAVSPKAHKFIFFYSPTLKEGVESASSGKEC